MNITGISPALQKWINQHTYTDLLINKCIGFENNERYHKLKFSRWKIQITENLRSLKRDNH